MIPSARLIRLSQYPNSTPCVRSVGFISFAVLLYILTFVLATAPVTRRVTTMGITSPTQASAHVMAPTNPVSTTFTASTQPIFGSSFLGASTSSSLYTDDRSADLDRAKTSLATLEKQMDALLPAQEELRTKRLANEAELATVTRQKQELTLKLSQASATFEAENAILQENQAILERERQLVAIGQQELAQAESILNARRTEKEQVRIKLHVYMCEYLIPFFCCFPPFF
jgi:hypothetical protein